MYGPVTSTLSLHTSQSVVLRRPRVRFGANSDRRRRRRRRFLRHLGTTAAARRTKTRTLDDAVRLPDRPRRRRSRPPCMPSVYQLLPDTREGGRPMGPGHAAAAAAATAAVPASCSFGGK